MPVIRNARVFPLLAAAAIIIIAGLVSTAAPAAYWDEEVRLTTAGGTSSTAKTNAGNIVVDASGRVHVVFADNRLSGSCIWYKTFNGTYWTWGTRLTGSGQQHYPAVAVDSLNNIHIVWTDYRHGSSSYSSAEIYYIYHDGAWSAEERWTYSGSARYPSTAAYANEVHVVWEDSKTGSCDIYCRHFDGMSWSSEERVTTSATSSMMPTTAVDEDGNLHIAWTEAGTPDGDVVRYSKYDGIAWEPYQDLDTTFSLSMGATSIATGAGGKVYVGWHAKPSEDEGYEIYCRRFDGVSWVPTERLTYTAERSRHTSLAAHLDTLYVVYSDDHPGNGEIYCKMYDGTAWEPEERITYATGTSYYPSATTGHDGRLHIVWEDWRVGGASQTEVYYRAHTDWIYEPPEIYSIAPDEGPEDETVPALITGAEFFADAQVRLEKSGHLDVVATDVVVVSPESISCNLDLAGADIGYWDVVVENLDGQSCRLAAGFEVLVALWEDELRLTHSDSLSSTAKSNAENIAADPSGNLHVVWYDERDGDYNIYYKKYDGVSWSADLALTTDPAPQTYPAIATDDLGRVHVVWCDYRHPGREIYYRCYDGGWLAEERLTSYENISEHPAVAVGPDNKIHVVWQYHVGVQSEDIYYMVHDGVGWSAPQEVTDTWGHSLLPAVGVDGSGNVHVVWIIFATNEGDQVRHTMYDGIAWSPHKDLDSTSAWTLGAPSIAVEANGEVHVGWQAKPPHDPEYDIYYCRFDGASWGTKKRLTYSPERSHHTSIATHDGSVYMVYADKRSGNSEIYYRVHAGVDWSEERRITFAGGESIQPAATTDYEGRLHVVWEDDRHGDSEVYYRMWDPGDISGTGEGDLARFKPAGVRVLPNPVRHDAQIRFHIGTQTRAAVSIYSITGSLVWSRELGVVPVGQHHLSWPGTDEAGNPVSPGVYFLGLETERRTSTAKIIVIK